MRIVLSTLAASAIALGSGCSFPISHDDKGEISLNVGSPDATCTKSDSVTSSDGKTTTTYAHTVDGAHCKLNATVNTQFADMKAIRDAVEAQLKSSGTDPKSIKVTISGLTLAVDEAKLVDGAGNPLPTAGVVSYTGGVGTAGDHDIVTVTMAEGADALNPVAASRDSNDLNAAAAAAYAANTPIAAVGEAEVVLDFAQIANFQTVTDPQLHLKYSVHVSGTAGF
jgi:hypothetical protein